MWPVDGIVFSFSGLGNEGGGVDPELLAISRSVLIPQDPCIESLNVGAAAAVCLFEMRRIRRELK